MTAAAGSDAYACPKCGERSTKAALTTQSYHCPRCTLEVAHLELAPNGAVRHVHGWLCTVGHMLHERYRVGALLGKGGFGATYLVADDRLAGKRRAVKEIPKDLYDESETALLARLQHPAIPDICDRFESDGMVYLVLEFGGTRSLEGERRASAGKIAVERLLPWMRQLCDVLTYLHEQDPPVVHRDLKPENVLLDEHDRIMLVDFGVAKQSDLGSATRTIARSATHGFSPPEQVLGTGTDQRSDVYALGATMFALLSGTVPPAAHERVAGKETAAVHEIEPTVPLALSAAIGAALDLNINRRPQSIRAFQALLDPAAVPPPMPAPTGGAGPRTERIAPSRPTGPAAAPATTRVGAQAPKMVPGRSLSTVVGVGVVLLLAAAALLWALLRDRPADSPAPPATGSSPSTSVAPTTVPPVSSTVPPVPVESAPTLPTATLPPQPSSPVTPPPSDGKGALDQIEQLRKSQPPEPAARPAPPPPAARPRPTPPPAPRPRRSAPADGGWNIRPEGATRTN